MATKVADAKAPATARHVFFSAGHSVRLPWMCEAQLCSEADRCVDLLHVRGLGVQASEATRFKASYVEVRGVPRSLGALGA